MNRTKRHCPECKQVLLKTDDSCFCGWQIQQRMTHGQLDNRCHYQVANHRCVLPGTMCPYPYGSSAQWYCSGHWRALNDPIRGESILIEAEKNYRTIMESRIDWRTKLFPDEISIKKAKKLSI
jgi:hypothetical protein